MLRTFAARSRGFIFSTWRPTLQTALLLAGLFVPTMAQGVPFSVRPILFVPSPSSFPTGFQPTEAELATDMQNIAAALDRVRIGYANALGLQTSLRVEPVARIDGFGGLASYGITWNQPENRYSDGISVNDSFWGAALNEAAFHGFNPGTPDEPYINVIFFKGAGGWAGGAQWHGSSGGGNAILGDWALDSFADRVPAEDAVWWWTGARQQTSATAHEIGHVLGLAHPDLINPVSGSNDFEYSFMGSWWNWPDWQANPADPSWALRGLHGWASNAGPAGQTPSYADQFLGQYRSPWFVTPIPEPATLVLAATGSVAIGALAMRRRVRRVHRNQPSRS